MGVIRCPIHGRSDLCFACEHLRAMVDGAERIGVLVRYSVTPYTELEFALCEGCTARVFCGKLPSEDADSDIFDQLSSIATSPACERCEALRGPVTFVRTIQVGFGVQ